MELSSHPVNLALRFLLEITALISSGIWGWNQGEGWFRYVLAIGIPVIFAVIWGVFAVPNDPSRSGSAPVITPGIIRIIIEIAILGFGAWALYTLNYPIAGIIFGLILILHYIISWDRIIWLISGND